MSLNGILPIDKPLDIRSTACVDAVRRILGRKIKTGHGGTLDSTASGLLIILLGNATRLSSFVMDMPKCYEVEAALGASTSTDDASGDIISKANWEHVTDSMVDTALCGFLGWRMQVPPSVSAVHIEGKLAHALARSGVSVQISPKPVFFEKIQRINDLDSCGFVSFRIFCRKGTYIRSFVRDIGKQLGTAAYVNKLKRTSCGTFSLNECKTLDEISKMDCAELRSCVLGLNSLHGVCTSYVAEESSLKRISNGQSVMSSNVTRKVFGKYSSPSGHVTVSGHDVFSVCKMSASKKTIEFVPSVNIFTDRS